MLSTATRISRAIEAAKSLKGNPDQYSLVEGLLIAKYGLYEKTSTKSKSFYEKVMERLFGTKKVPFSVQKISYKPRDITILHKHYGYSSASSKTIKTVIHIKPVRWYSPIVATFKSIQNNLRNKKNIARAIAAFRKRTNK